MKTRTELIEATLKLLNAVGAGQAPAAEDVGEIDRIIDGVIEELNDINAYTNMNRDEFEDKHVDALATILAVAAAPAFGQAKNYDSKADAVMRLRAMTPETYVSGSVLAVDYF
ncbi:hypothetical protein ACQZ46_02615 [Agrobacterium salinitolerans]